MQMICLAIRPHCRVSGNLHAREQSGRGEVAVRFHLQFPLQPRRLNQSPIGYLDQGVQVRGCGRRGRRQTPQGAFD